jgi:hypothetical protein
MPDDHALRGAAIAAAFAEELGVEAMASIRSRPSLPACVP